MKKLWVPIVAVLFVIGGFAVYKVTGTAKEGGSDVGLAVMYDSLEDITDASEFVVKVTFVEEFTVYERQLTDQIVTENHYKVKVTEVIKDNGAVAVGDEITVSCAISLKMGSNSNPIKKMIIHNLNLSEGNYLLFLNKSTEEDDLFVFVSPHHLYKEASKNEYVNVIKGTRLKSIIHE